MSLQICTEPSEGESHWQLSGFVYPDARGKRSVRVLFQKRLQVFRLVRKELRLWPLDALSEGLLQSERDQFRARRGDDGLGQVSTMLWVQRYVLSNYSG